MDTEVNRYYQCDYNVHFVHSSHSSFIKGKMWIDSKVNRYNILGIQNQIKKVRNHLLAIVIAIKMQNCKCTLRQIDVKTIIISLLLYIWFVIRY